MNLYLDLFLTFAKVGTLTLSPRGDWRMPSDAVARLWLDQLEGLE